MVGSSSGSFLNVRPTITRARSHTSPTNPAPNLDPRNTEVKQPTRPDHARSHSYVTPVEEKFSNAATFSTWKPHEKTVESRFPRLHLAVPGKHHHHHRSPSEDRKTPLPHKSHRYTQSESQQYIRHQEKSRKHGSLTPDVETPVSSDRIHDLPYPSSRGPPIPSLKRMTSSRSYRLHHLADTPFHSATPPPLYRRATSDGRSPPSNMSTEQTVQQTSAPPKSEVEMLLERAARRRASLHYKIANDKTEFFDAQLKSARSELSGRLSNTTNTASNLMRRLDYANDTLRRTAESLLDTISSFSNLSQQSAKLMSNFDHETSHLDSTLRSRMAKFRDEVCTKRAERIEELENRGKKVAKTSEELSRRLENCRTIVKNWEDREVKKRKAWKGVWNGLFWGVLLIFLAVVAGIVSWKIIEVSGGADTPAGRLHQGVKANESAYNVGLEGIDVPEDVKAILRDIATRSDGHEAVKLNLPDVEEVSGGSSSGSSGSKSMSKKEMKLDAKLEKALRAFDEL